VGDLPDPADTESTGGTSGEGGSGETGGKSETGGVEGDGGATGEGGTGGRGPGSGGESEAGGAGKTGGASSTGGVGGDGGDTSVDGGPDASDGGASASGGTTGTGGVVTGGTSGGGATGGGGGATGGAQGSGGKGTGGSGTGGVITCTTDADHDTFISSACGGDDCDDSNAAVFPGQGTYFPDQTPKGGFDYNCNSTPDKDPALNVIVDCGVVLAKCPLTTVGYIKQDVGPATPACGVSGSFGTCVKDPTLGLTCAKAPSGMVKMTCH
jgi:hypothetical protein